MRNRTKRGMTIYIVLMMFALLGVNVIQYVYYSVVVDDVVSLHYAKDVLNVTGINMNTAPEQIAWWSTALLVWMILMQIIASWFIADKLAAYLKRRLPDEPFISKGRTKIGVYKRRNA